MRKLMVVRPYPSRIRQRVFDFLGRMGFEVPPVHQVEAGTPDDEAAREAEAHRYDLLLLPYHVHRDRDDKAVDGIAVAELLGATFLGLRAPILMPVTAGSWVGSFPRRLKELADKSPEVHARLLPMQESEIGSDRIRQTLIERFRALGKDLDA